MFDVAFERLDNAQFLVELCVTLAGGVKSDELLVDLNKILDEIVFALQEFAQVVAFDALVIRKDAAWMIMSLNWN